jgi:serine/threonine protein kinase
MAEPGNPNALPPGTPLLEYRIMSVLGADGFGITYLAHDAVLQKSVVIKEYFPSDLAQRDPRGNAAPARPDTEPNYRKGLAQFLIEARALARFVHPNIVRVDRCIEANGTAYMLREYEKGESLAQHLARAPQPAEVALKAMLVPLLAGLQAVHSAGVLHRDIKPVNIFLRDDGTPVLLDFGAARLASRDAMQDIVSILTPGYAPPEQYLRSGRQGPWSDIYSLAAVLFLAVTGEPPPDALSRLRMDDVGKMLNATRVWYSGPFIEAIQWGLAVEEDRRPRSVAQWREALLHERPAPVVPQAGARDASDATRKYVWMALGAVIFFVFIAGTDIWKQRAEHVRATAKAPKQLDRPVRAPDAAHPAAGGAGVGLSREEVAQNLPHLAGMFSDIDADKSGKVTIEELQSFWKRGTN